MRHVFELKRRGLHILDDDPHLRIAANEQIQSAKEAMQKISKEASGALVPGVSLYRRDSLLRGLTALGSHLDAFQKEAFLGFEAIKSQLEVFPGTGQSIPRPLGRANAGRPGVILGVRWRRDHLHHGSEWMVP